MLRLSLPGPSPLARFSSLRVPATRPALRSPFEGRRQSKPLGHQSCLSVARASQVAAAGGSGEQKKNSQDRSKLGMEGSAQQRTSLGGGGAARLCSEALVKPGHSLSLHTHPHPDL